MSIVLPNAEAWGDVLTLTVKKNSPETQGSFFYPVGAEPFDHSTGSAPGLEARRTFEA